MELTGDSGGAPVEPLAGALQHPLRLSYGLIAQHGVGSRGEIELSVAVGMGAGERKKSLCRRMQHV